MILDKETLLEMHDHINKLNEQVGLSLDTYMEITTAIDRELEKRMQEEKYGINDEITIQHKAQ